MQINVYDGEKLERWKWWYIIFMTAISFMIIMSILTDNFVGAILLFFLVWGYMLFSMWASKQIKLTIVEEWFKVWWALYPWSNVWWFVLEIDEKSQIIKNIVLLIWNNKLIHTIEDDADNIKQFIMILSDVIPMLADYEKTFIEKLIRRMKL